MRSWPLGAACVLLALAWACAKGAGEDSAEPEDDGASGASTGGSAPGAGGNGLNGPGGAGGELFGGAGGAAGGGAGNGGAGDGGSGGGCTPLMGCGIDDPNPTTRCTGSTVATPMTAPGGTVWASSVVAFSSQYLTGSWAATQTLAAPNTYPTYGDLATAWATSVADGVNEFITVAFPANTVGSMVWIFETLNPDAIRQVTVTTALGNTVVYQVTAASVGGCAYVLTVPTATTEPVLQVRLDLSSEVVTGWNEIDAIGVVP